MNAFLEPPSPDDGRRRSRRVALMLLGTVGVVGGVAAWDALKRTSPDSDATPPVPASQPAPKPINADQTYANNDFIPGVGYYHAPYHGWFPFPYNYHDSSRGYFAGGLWQAAPFLLGMMASRPSADAVAFAAQRQREEEDRRRAQSPTSGFAGTRVGGSGFSSARPAPTPSRPASSPSIIRGGFGSSAHGSSGAS